MKVMMYKERGGKSWCLCKIIAEYEDKIWLHNLHVGSMPVKRKNSIEMKEADEYLEDLQS
jgi:hypothetical protein